MPLPRAVPTFDPDRTLVGRAAIDQDTMLSGDDFSAPTVRATPVDVRIFEPTCPGSTHLSRTRNRGAIL